MQSFAAKLRERARVLGLSDAEVARRAGLSERRYAYYATGEREPNLATLVEISRVLAVTPNDLLLPAEKQEPKSSRERLIARASAAVGNLTEPDLRLAVCQLECFLDHRVVSRRKQRSRV